MEEVKLPELGEGIDRVEVSSVLVKVGDRVAKDDPIVEVETEKASLEVPSTVSGRVEEVLVEKGGEVGVGQVLVRIAAGAEAADAAPVQQAAAEEAEPTQTAADAASVIEFPATPSSPARSSAIPVPAAPSSRALARQLGVDIASVPGSGPRGRISRADVKAYAKRLITGAAGTAGPSAVAAPAALPDFSHWGEVESRPLTRVRRTTAANMAQAWSTVPHVTQFDRSDITQIESMRKRYNKRPEAAERKLTMTAIVIKMVAAALRQFPQFNASLDPANDAVVLKKYVHIGFAADTERGLLVPVIRDVDRKSLPQVTTELNDLAARARAKKISPDEMRGASFTVSNLGGLGTTYFSPIVSWPEVAILGVGRATIEAVHDGQSFEPRLLMPLSLSYDHRWIDGADAARFLRWLAEALEQPLLLLLDE